MLAVNMVKGGIILAIVGGAVWGICFILELLYKAMGESLQYLIVIPLVLLLASFVGAGFTAHKASTTKVKH